MVKQWRWALPRNWGVRAEGWARVGAMALQPGCMLPRVRMQKAVIVELCVLPKLHSGKAWSNPRWHCSLSHCDMSYFAVCVRITWYHTWMMKAKWNCTGEPLLATAQSNQHRWPFMRCVWVLNGVTLIRAHLNIMYLCNELERKLFLFPSGQMALTIVCHISTLMGVL